MPLFITNRVILFSIQVIYKKRQLGKPYHLIDVKRLLANQMMLEESLSVTNNRVIEFEKVWGSVYLDLSEFKVKKNYKSFLSLLLKWDYRY